MRGRWGVGSLVVASLSGTLLLCGVVRSQESQSEKKLAEGQVWEYRTRSHESQSRVVIGRIENLPDLGSVVHVKLIGLKLRKSSASGQEGSVISHVPVARSQFLDSVTRPTREAADLEGFEEGYQVWLDAFRSGNAGVFSLPLAEIVELIGQTTQEPPRPDTEE